MVDSNLKTILACPRDRAALRCEGNNLICREGHAYPTYDGIPVFLLEEVEQTAWWASESLKKARSEPPARPPSSSAAGIDPHVQEIIAATCGLLYRPLIHRLREYPIPRLRLPDAPDRIFVDIGCNWGRWSIAAARKGYHVIGIDPSLEAVMAARRICDQLGLHAEFVVGDARFLPFKERSIDCAFSYSVIQHFSKENAKITLRSIASVLKPGGIAFIQMPNKFGIRSFYHLARRGFREGEKFEVRYWSPSELLATFRTIFGHAEISVDGYFGLGIQASDVHLLPAKYRMVVHASEFLRHLARRAGWLRWFADSLYIRSVRSLANNGL